ncbi:MAG: hypothetical protein NDF54_12130 [archaeon GB-1867-035]|nr:hypothetical protein [Candidatus Culexmicrobium profundum]
MMVAKYEVEPTAEFCFACFLCEGCLSCGTSPAIIVVANSTTVAVLFGE